MPIRIYALAKELKIDSKDLVDICTKAGILGKGSALASLEDDEIVKLKAFMDGGGAKKAATGPAPLVDTKTVLSSPVAGTVTLPPPPPPQQRPSPIRRPATVAAGAPSAAAAPSAGGGGGVALLEAPPPAPLRLRRASAADHFGQDRRAPAAPPVAAPPIVEPAAPVVRARCRALGSAAASII